MSQENEPSDQDLIRLSLIEKNSFSMIIARYEEPLSRYIRRLGVQNPEDILDILQEIFINVYRNLNEFDASFKFSSWVYRIAHNETINFFRKRRVRPEGHLAENGENILKFIESEEWRGGPSFDTSLNAEVINEAIDALDEKYREIIVLRFFEHKEYDEISDILKIPTGSVGTLIHRAKKRLFEKIDINKIAL